MYYSHKGFTGTITKAEEDGILLTQVCDLPVSKGQLIFQPIQGDPQIIDEDTLNEVYIPVEVIEKKPKKTMSPFEEQYMKQLLEFSGLESQEEDENYILKTREISKNNS